MMAHGHVRCTVRRAVSVIWVLQLLFATRLQGDAADAGANSQVTCHYSAMFMPQLSSSTIAGGFGTSLVAQQSQTAPAVLLQQNVAKRVHDVLSWLGCRPPICLGRRHRPMSYAGALSSSLRTLICTCSWLRPFISWISYTPMGASAYLKLKKLTGNASLCNSTGVNTKLAEPCCMCTEKCSFSSDLIDALANGVLVLYVRREVIRLAPEHSTMGVYTNLGALLMGAGRLSDCLPVLHAGIAIAKQYEQTTTPLVCHT